MVRAKRHNGVSILEVDGNIEPKEMVQVKNELKRLMDRHRFKIILHFYGLKNVDYVGLGILVENLQRFRELNGDLKLVGLTTKAKRIFQRLGTWNIFETYPDEEAALKSFKPIYS